MQARNIILLAVLLSGLLLAACGGKKQSLSEITTNMARRALVDDYPRIPGEEILQSAAGTRLYTALTAQYTYSLDLLKRATDSDGVKLLVVILSTESADERSPATTYGNAAITRACTNLGVDYTDLSEDIAALPASSVRDYGTYFSKTGAAFVAGKLADIVSSYEGYEAATIKRGSSPKLLGDLDTDNETIDDGIGPAYRLKVNNQGLRMDYDLTFPKRRQRILFLGDEYTYCPYLDNQFTFTGMLQQRYPGKEIINAAKANYTMEDYSSLYRHRARYAQPDVVIVCTNGYDILEYYFTQRNRYSRTLQAYKPSPVELQFYKTVLK